MSRLSGLAFCILAISLSGCGAPDDPPADTPTDSRVSDDNVFKDQVRALEKAEEVQKTLDEATARQQNLIEEQAQ